MTLRKAIGISILVSGVTAVSSQIIFLRELLVVFYGNEVSIGIILGAWMAWGAAGGVAASRLSYKIRSSVGVFSFSQAVLAALVPLTFLLIRSSKNIIGLATGEIAGYGSMVSTVFLVLMPSCFTIGLLFTLACGLYRTSGASRAEGIARIYVAEASGALLGGAAVSYFLFIGTPSFYLTIILFILNMSASILTQIYRPPARSRHPLIWCSSALTALSLIFLFSGLTEKTLWDSTGKLWRGFEVEESRDSLYANITVTREEGQRSFYGNGLHLFTVPDILPAEESAHFVLLQHTDPSEVLLIGGGSGGIINEILKHPVKRIDYIELDPAIIGAARRNLSDEYTDVFDDPRVNVVIEDGRLFVKRTDNKYDCAIINLGDPYTAQINRFYTADFFMELSGAMKTGGIAGFSLTSSPHYIGGELRDYLGSVLATACKVFPQVIVIPGDTAHFIVSKTEGKLTEDAGELAGRINERGLDTSYVRDYYLFDRLSEGRISYAKEALTENGLRQVNRDFRPITYYYAMLFWSTQFNSPLIGRIFRYAVPGRIWAGGLIFCFLLAVFWTLSGRRRKERAALTAVMTTGFAEINFQIAVILAFQVIYGYVFYKMGVIITSFMVGLAAGGWLVLRVMSSDEKDMNTFIRVQAAVCIYPMILPPVFLWLSLSKASAVSWLGSNIIFTVLPALAGFIGGFQFPLAGKIYMGGGRDAGRTAGITYGLDLIGGCTGSILAGAFLVPVIGIFGLCFLTALINFTVLVLLILGSFTEKRGL